MIITELTREFYRAVEGEYPPMTIRGIACLYGDKVVAILGISVIDGHSFIICNAGDIKKRDIIKAWRYFSDKYLIKGKDYYSIIDRDIDTAASFNHHFGFNHLMGDIYIKRN